MPRGNLASVLIIEDKVPRPVQALPMKGGTMEVWTRIVGRWRCSHCAARTGVIWNGGWSLLLLLLGGEEVLLVVLLWRIRAAVELAFGGLDKLGQPAGHFSLDGDASRCIS